MEATTTIKKMLKEGRIVVPDYQRAYSWDADLKGEKQLHVNVFLADLEQYATLPPGLYYFGHFLFQTTQDSTSDGDEILAIVDGQQRLTTITIFLASLFAQLREIRPLSEEEQHLEEDLVHRGRGSRFETVDHDRVFFQEYVIGRTRTDREKLPYVSQRRIADATDCIRKFLAAKGERSLVSLLKTVANARCTTDTVGDSGEAMQMFLFQNNRGKKPTKLEVVKALLMRTAYLHGGKDRDDLLRNMDDRFAEIYREISAMEHYVDEDEVLLCACRIAENSLYADVSLPEIEKKLAENGVLWAEQFSIRLSECFRELRGFFVDDAECMLEAHALRQIGCGNWVLPIIVRVRSFGLSASARISIWRVLESLAVRHRMVGTRAVLISRLNDIFKAMTAENAVESLTERLKRLAGAKDWWWAYWNNDTLKNAVESNWYSNYHSIAKIILWKYENFLIEKEGKAGYAPISYSSIKNPHLEHIAPQTENEEVAAGYDTYDEDFKEKYLLSLGNFLLLSAPHNESIGNRPFASKRESYNQLKQQREIQIMTENDCVWDRVKIAERREKIVNFILEYL